MARVFLLSLLVLFTVIVLAACAPAAPSAPPTTASSTGAPVKATDVPAAEKNLPSAGGTLVRAITSEPAQIDPQGAASSGLSLVIPYLFDTLVVRDVNNKLLPALGDSWIVSDDGRTITMTLHADVVFQDGTPMNAEAVRATFQRFKDSGQKSPIYPGIQSIDKIDVVDSLTVRFSFREPAANFWSTISMPYAGIISPNSIRKMTEAGGKGQLVGTGPFLLGEWKAGQSITLKRNPAYKWGSALTLNRGAPYLDAMVFKVIPEATTQLTALEKGDVDAIFVNQPDHRTKLEKNQNVRLQDAVLNSIIYLGYNMRKAPFTDSKVRQGLSHAVNKDEILKLALGGIGLVAHAPLPPTLPGYDDSLKQSELVYDPQKATALLKEAGFSSDGKQLKGILITSNRAPNDAIATLLQSQFKAVGVAVEIRQLDSKAVMDATNKGEFDLLLYRYDWNDPDALNIYLGSKTIGSTNRVAYSNPEVDKLLLQGATELDEKKRVILYQQAQKVILQDAPWQPLYVPLDVLAFSKRLKGIQVGFMGRMLVNDTYVVGE